MNRHLLRVLQALLTIGLLAWVFRDPTIIENALPVIARADQRWLIFGLLLAGIDQVFNIIRWNLYLRVQGVHAGWKLVTKTFMAGLFFNLLLPGMVSGDVVKIALLGTAVRGRWGAITLSVIADRLIGLSSLVLLCFGVAWVNRVEWLAPTATSMMSALFWFMVLFSVGSVLALGVPFLITSMNWLRFLPKWFPFKEKIIGLGEAWHLFVKEWRISLAAVALSFPVLFTYFGVFWCVARALKAGVGVTAILTVMPAITVVSSLPIAFSGLGPREESFKVLLQALYNVPNEYAVLISLGGYALYAVWSATGLLFCHSEIPRILALLKKPFEPLTRAGQHENDLDAESAEINAAVPDETRH